ncbi:hypothetical protein [Rhodoplanes azumiensis]|uniref:Phasin domain-containing protein n=1 Tax=Rhodoplanes azumiensis TaxID=1897628 RepID=A0ABW5AEY8_9BRAD
MDQHAPLDQPPLDQAPLDQAPLDQAPLDRAVETVHPPIVLAPGEAPPSVPDDADPPSGVFTIGQWVPTALPSRRPVPNAPEPPVAGAGGTAVAVAARTGADFFQQNTAMARNMLAVGAEMTTHMNACARAHLDMVARSNVELFGAALRASTDLSEWTRRYLDVLSGDRMTAFMRHRTPQHLALLQAEAFHTGLETMLGWARATAARVAAERVAVERATAERATEAGTAGPRDTAARPAA